MGDAASTEIERWLGRVDVRPDLAPDWLAPAVAGVGTIGAERLSRNDPPATTAGPRQAAVLVLVGERPGAGPDVLLQQRAPDMRDHAGEASFPGGAREPRDDGPVATALREAVEETGLNPADVVPLAILPRIFIPPSRFQVTGVLAHWRRPSAVASVDPAESVRVVRVPLRDLADPANRLTVRRPGWRGPAFAVERMIVWGYTGEVLDALLRLGGWARPWDAERVVDLDEAWARVREG